MLFRSVGSLLTAKIVSIIGIMCSLGVLAGLAAAVLIWRKRSPLLMILMVFVLIALLVQLFIFF